MKFAARITLLAACLWGNFAIGQAAQREPHIGFAYPDGGQRGTTVEIEVGGQALAGAKQVHFSGTGISAKVKFFVRPGRPLEREQRQELMLRLRARQADLEAGSPAAEAMNAGEMQMMSPEMNGSDAAENVELPNEAIIEQLGTLNARELEFVVNQFLSGKKRQENVQIADRLLLEVQIAPDAPLGEREFRIETNGGLTNPVRFHIGGCPELLEREPVPVRGSKATDAENRVAALPAVLNGQILPGDSDRFRFGAKAGEQLVFQTLARRLTPYLADAVPGWFQPTLLLSDAEGHEVAFEDDFRTDPDPVLACRIPGDGDYVLEIRDSLYRGREDFVYRILAGQAPFITQVYPLGGGEGVETTLSIEGWNLPTSKLAVDTAVGRGPLRRAFLENAAWRPIPVLYAVDTLPECNESEPNDAPRPDTLLRLPMLVNGQIAKPGDADVFGFTGHAGEQIVADVDARRLNSPLDALLRLLDSTGKVIAWNDDCPEADAGWVTHQSDAYLNATLPADGDYFVSITDAQAHGDPSQSYRLRIGPPRPDFAVIATPSSLNLRAGRSAVVTLHAIRKDGFDGDIQVSLKDPPAGFTLQGACIPKDCERIRMTVSTVGKTPKGLHTLNFEARAEVGGIETCRKVAPAEEMMQAFIYQHLVPSERMVALVRPAAGPALRINLDGQARLALRAGGTAEVTVALPKAPALDGIQLALTEPPAGLSLDGPRVIPEGLVFTLHLADGAGTGFPDNLIVEAFGSKPAAAKNPDRPAKNQRVSLGVLPAIPAEVLP